MLVKLYGEDPQVEKRYSPAECIGARKEPVAGRPDSRHISTSYVERQNLTMRMCMRRFTRLTNAFSKDLEHHVAAIALHYMYYNFVRIPPNSTGVSDHVWEIADIVGLLEAEKAKRPDPKEQRYERFGPALGH